MWALVCSGLEGTKRLCLLKRPSDVLSLIDKRGDRYVAVLLEDDSSYVGREVPSAPLVLALRSDSVPVATSASAPGACALHSLILRIAHVLFSRLTREDSFTEKTVGTGWGAASQRRQKQLPRAAASPGGPGGLTADVVPRTHSIPEGVLCLVGVMVQTLSAVFWTPNFAKSSALQLPDREGVLSASQSRPCGWSGGWGVAPTRLGVTSPV